MEIRLTSPRCYLLAWVNYAVRRLFVGKGMVDEKSLVKKPKIHIPDDDPFANDELGRKEYAEQLTGFLSTIKESLILLRRD